MTATEANALATSQAATKESSKVVTQAVSQSLIETDRLIDALSKLHYQKCRQDFMFQLPVVLLLLAILVVLAR